MDMWSTENSEIISALDEPVSKRKGIRRRLKTDGYQPHPSDHRKNYGSDEKDYLVQQPQSVFYLPEHSDKGKQDYGFLLLLMIKVLLIAILLPVGFAMGAATIYFLACNLFQLQQSSYTSSNSSTVTVIINNNCTSNSTTARHLDTGCQTLNATVLISLISDLFLKKFNFGIYLPIDSDIFTKGLFYVFVPLLNKLCIG